LPLLVLALLIGLLPLLVLTLLTALLPLLVLTSLILLCHCDLTHFVQGSTA
jgi:hypothetical protein